MPYIKHTLEEIHACLNYYKTSGLTLQECSDAHNISCSTVKYHLYKNSRISKIITSIENDPTQIIRKPIQLQLSHKDKKTNDWMANNNIPLQTDTSTEKQVTKKRSIFSLEALNQRLGFGSLKK